jgi:hypothetical protein
VHVIRNSFVAFLATLFAAVVLLMGGGSATAQQNTRSFQMVLWSDPSLTDASLNNGDIRSFSFSQESQPPQGPTIMVNYAPGYDYTVGNVGGVIIDWSRVVAVLADEPYGPQADPRIDSVIKYPDGSSACPGDPAPYIAPIDALLQQRATELKTLAPKARFWVNFTEDEAKWMATCHAPGTFNRSYIDVISADWSADGGSNDIASMQLFLSEVAAVPSKPDQQLALIAGVYSAPANQLPHLQGFFDYANQKNQANGCYLPLGNRGLTGIFDGCPVWIVLGWFSGEVTAGGKTYVGMLEPGSESIKQRWEQELHVPLEPALAHQRTPAQLIQPIVQLLLN